jgi:membrane-anchored mycosin MYCP
VPVTRTAGALAGATLAAALAVPLGPLGPAPAWAAEGPACESVQQGMSSAPVTGPSVPLDLLGVQRAQELVRSRLVDGRHVEPGERANVAVLDSGVGGGSAIDVAAHHSVTGRSDLLDWHGTAVAGIIAGRPDGDRTIGVAPAARIVDVRVFDTSNPDSTDPGAQQVSPALLAQGLRWVADNAARLDIAVANVSLSVTPDPRVRSAISELWSRDVVVVASSGNRPETQGQPGYAEFGGDPRPGQDAAGVFFPAAYPHVVAVNATGDGSGADAASYVVPSSDTDVAAPTFGLVTIGLDGSPCVIGQVATSWSAALVSGVVSLLRSAYPHDSAAQTVARLVATADGTTDTPTRMTGYGVVQPVEALTRAVEPARNGTVAHAVVAHDERRATPPEPATDVLADTRDHAIWWGLLGGGVLVVALLLRPVLARRR